MLTERIKECAKEILVKDGYVSPVFFIALDEQLIMEPQSVGIIDKIYGDNLPAEEAKTREVFCLGAIAKKFGGNRLIMVWYAAMRTMTPDAQYDPSDPTEQPLSYPKSMRTECIIVNDINLLTGEDKTLIVPYKGGDGEPVVFLPDLDTPDEIQSRFTAIALEGYRKVA